MPSPPLVALTATTRLVDGVPRVRLNESYLRAVEGAGLLPMVVPPLATPQAVARFADLAAGVVLTGGEDVDPSLYGAPPHAELGPVHAARDATELALFAAARERGVPTLAICRGVQVVNVALGGTLVQHIPAERAGAGNHDRDDARTSRVHPVSADAGSRLAETLRATSLTVNSIHHQSIDRLGRDLRITAAAADGIVEGVETTDHGWWMLGVQWHPEELIDTTEPWDRHLFAAFAQACRARD